MSYTTGNESDSSAIAAAFERARSNRSREHHSDREYLALAQDPEANRERLLAMVYEAAKEAMPNTKVVVEDGNPMVAYHQSPDNFNVFRKGVRDGLSGRGI